MSAAEIQRIEPPVTAASAPFWDATRERRLLLPWCTSCEAPFFYPRDVCPTCLEARIEWREASGRGTVYAITVEHRPQNPAMTALAPYAVALIELEEGVRFLSNVIVDDPTSVNVDDEVSVTWEALPDGRNLPLFHPARA